MDLKEYIETEQITVFDFAEAVGASTQAVYKWLSGERRPRDFKQIIRVTNGQVTANDFYGQTRRGIKFDELGAGQ